MGSAAALAIRLIDVKKNGTPLTVLDTSTAIEGIIRINRVATRPDSREYLKELIVSPNTTLEEGYIVQSDLSGDIYIIVSLDPSFARHEAAVNIALLAKANSLCDVYEYAPPSTDVWGEPTAASFTQQLTGIYGMAFTALPDEDQRAYGSRGDGIFTVVIPKRVFSTYRPTRGDRIATTDLYDGHVRTWQIDLVDPDFHGPNAYKLLVSEDNR